MKKVLILEDEVNIRSFVVINLQRAGYDTIEAGTGAEALEQLRQEPGYRRGDPGYHAAGYRRLRGLP